MFNYEFVDKKRAFYFISFSSAAVNAFHHTFCDSYTELMQKLIDEYLESTTRVLTNAESEEMLNYIKADFKTYKKVSAELLLNAFKEMHKSQNYDLIEAAIQADVLKSIDGEKAHDQ